jgi:hypothetical protein
MKVASKKRVKFALWVLVALVLVMTTAGTIFAAGEQLERSSVVSGGGTTSSGGFTLMATAGLPVAGSDIASDGVGLCSGFGCNSRSSGSPEETELELFMPSVNKSD